MHPPKGPSSSGGRRGRKARTIKSKLTPLGRMSTPNDLAIGSYLLEKPSEVRGAPKWEREVCLELEAVDKFSLRILTEIDHPNILHLESVVTEGSSTGFLVDKYTMSLYCFASQLLVTKLGDFVKLQQIIRQIIEGINELRQNDMYHGNLNILSTYFEKGSMLVKLANFKEKVGKNVVDAQFEDWCDVGNAIDGLAALVKKNAVLFDLSVMHDLANNLKSARIRGISIGLVKEDALAHVFFWSKIRRKSFFIYDITVFLRSDEFKSEVKDLECIPKDWNLNGHGGLLAEMNKYRAGLGLLPYTSTRHQYVLFVSGSYTHEKELQVSLDVDAIVSRESPHLCLELVKIARQLGCII